MTETETVISPEQAEADLRAAMSAPTAPPTPAKVETAPTQPGATEKVKVETPNELPTGTPAAADTKDKPSTTEPKKETQEPPKPEVAKSDFAKNQERLEKTWKSVNQRKTELDTKEQTLTQREQAIAQREEQFKVQSAKAQQKFTPEQYETVSSQKLELAKSYDLQAKGLEAQAADFEADGKYTEAESAKQRAQDFREQAAYQRGVSKQLKEQAAHVRANPDPTLEQHQAKNQKLMRDYTMEAAKQWPDVAKQGSEFQKTMAGHLQEAAKQGLDANEFPVLMYHVARLTAAETEAARVPELVKKLGAAEAKVKELEALTAPGGGAGSVQNAQTQETPFHQMTPEQQEAWLRQNKG
jgi:hypothetical protein